MVRISRDHDGSGTVSDPTGTVLTVTDSEWTAFTIAVPEDAFIDVDPA